jgi:hypothetical protein
LWPIHPLAIAPSNEQQQEIRASSGNADLQIVACNLFDMERRPFWVVNHIGSA